MLNVDNYLELFSFKNTKTLRPLFYLCNYKSILSSFCFYLLNKEI